MKLYFYKGPEAYGTGWHLVLGIERAIGKDLVGWVDALMKRIK